MSPRSPLPRSTPRSPAWPFTVALAGALLLAACRPDPDPSARGPVVEAPSAGDDRTSTSSAHPFTRGPDQLLQDAELVYGPADPPLEASADDAPFASLLATVGPRLPAHVAADGRLGPALARVAVTHSISPRLLLLLLALAPPPEGASLEQDLAQRAAWLADGYYGLKYRSEHRVQFADGSGRAGPVQAGAAHFAVARYLALGTDEAGWAALRQRFADVYDAWYGPSAVTPAPVAPGLRQPPLLLPWAEGQSWHYTGGPHGAWGIASAWGAVDFAPPSLVGCAAAPEWVVTAAPGRVEHASEGLVLLDLDMDRDLRTGWVLAYLHMASVGRARVGQVLGAGDPVGHPSCEGGVADGAHVHFARRFQGEWLPAAGGPSPLVLSGWSFESLGGEYDGSMGHSRNGRRMAVTSRRGGETAVVSDNGAAAWAVAQSGWQAPAMAAASASQHEGPSGDSAPKAAVAHGQPEGAPGWPDGASAGLTLSLRLPNAGGPADVPLTLELSSEAGSWTLGATMAADGWTEAVALPEAAGGPVDLRVLRPGHLPLVVLGLVLGGPSGRLDLSAGGQLLARPGDVDGNGEVGLADLGTWLRAEDGGPEADLDGDGMTGPGDLWQLVGALTSAR